MALTADLVASYRRPGAVLRRHLAAGAREDRALAILMLACFLIFVAQWPRLARSAVTDPERGFAALAAPEMFVWMVVAPLFFYGLAAASHLVARALGGQGSWFGARLALFWALFAAVPLWLLRGLVAGLVGPGPALEATGAIGLGIFALLWFSGLREAERAPRDGAEVRGP